jgi:hypothetical protein
MIIAIAGREPFHGIFDDAVRDALDRRLVAFGALKRNAQRVGER